MLEGEAEKWAKGEDRLLRHKIKWTCCTCGPQSSIRCRLMKHSRYRSSRQRHLTHCNTFFLQHTVKVSMIILRKLPSPWCSTSLYLDVQNLYLSDQPFSLLFHWIAQRFKTDRLNPAGNQGIINIPLQLLPWLSSIKIKFYRLNFMHSSQLLF